MIVTDSEAIVKVSGKGTSLGVDDTVTISLTADLIDISRQRYFIPEQVSIIGIQWAGEPGVVYKISRGGTKIASLLADNGNYITFNQLYSPDINNLTDDITVSINDSMGGFVQGEVWLRLRKISGYFNNTETLYFVDEYGNYINTESNQRITT